jgi:predicted acyl esterase
VFEAGSNVWKRYDTWPPKTAVSPRSVYMREGGALAWEPPATSAAAYDAYVSDVDYVVKLIDVYPDTGMKALRMNGYPFMRSQRCVPGALSEGPRQVRPEYLRSEAE